MTDWIDRLTELSKEYNFQLSDVPDILEEYILIDNEVIEQKNIENIIKEQLNNERTQLGQSVLKKTAEQLQQTLTDYENIKQEQNITEQKLDKITKILIQLQLTNGILTEELQTLKEVIK